MENSQENKVTKSLKDVYKELFLEQEKKKEKNDYKALNLSKTVEVEMTSDFRKLKKGEKVKTSFVVSEFYIRNKKAKKIS